MHMGKSERGGPGGEEASLGNNKFDRIGIEESKKPMLGPQI